MKYGVWCEVVSGVSARRGGWLMNGKNQPAEYPSREKAQQQAEVQHQKTRYHTRATFRWTAVPLEQTSIATLNLDKPTGAHE